ncbi:TetR/AcrR family transcriptional regulator [Glaciimonas immobilis]|uniref:AcrR family transcriptional regulator n=1 Tax=Glaciimonas immobilis TaxID=728004 RepID=A0A840RZP7_9BURK|nr:TetR/AcrR family transcriptional regulator [Glaciimonas immobilis]KAF3996207.1 TetR/AcrR family transcriptional regulator [Glaciimonas immobilis]MBB5202578.1 AcrR family transcriptional regulator [Glaciimonas immobilis]
MATRKSKTPQSPTHRAERKRADILKAAGKCFRKTGFHQTSMQEICNEVGLGPGAVYRYFTGKDAIIAAMAEDERRQARTMLSGFHDTDDLPQALHAITQAFAERYAETSDAGLMTEIYAEGLRNKKVGAIIKKAESEWVDGLADMLRTAQQRKQIDVQLDAGQVALLLTAMWDGLVIRQAYTQNPPEVLLGLFNSMLKTWLTQGAAPETPVKAKPAPKIKPPVVRPVTEKAAQKVEDDFRQANLFMPDKKKSKKSPAVPEVIERTQSEFDMTIEDEEAIETDLRQMSLI